MASNCFLTSGISSARAISREILATTFRGDFAGARIMCEASRRKAGNISFSVGTSGNTGERLGANTASGNSLKNIHAANTDLVRQPVCQYSSNAFVPSIGERIRFSLKRRLSSLCFFDIIENIFVGFPC